MELKKVSEQLTKSPALENGDLSRRGGDRSGIDKSEFRSEGEYWKVTPWQGVVYVCDRNVRTERTRIRVEGCALNLQVESLEQEQIVR